MGPFKKSIAVAALLLSVVVLIPMIAARDPLVWVMGLPTPFSDMTRRLEELPIPDDFQIVARRVEGVREGAAPEAEVGAWYAAEWGGGSLCERVLSLASAEGRPSPIRSKDCGWAVDVESGWSARAIYVWRYQVKYQVMGPEKRSRTYSDPECAPFRTNVDESLLERDPLCWAPDGSAIVSIRVVLPRY